VNGIDRYYKKHKKVPPKLRNYQAFSAIMMNAALKATTTHGSFIKFLISNEDEIDSYMSSGKLPKRVERVID
jgi:hypothetical protein